VEAPTDVDRVANAFGKKLNLDGPATPEDIAQDLGKYVQQVVQQQEQAALFNKANQAAAKIPPVGVDVPDVLPNPEVPTTKVKL
jgi:hypothetical protein